MCDSFVDVTCFVIYYLFIMAPLALPEVHESDRKPNWNVLRTFDLTLHYDDETLGHDETGCYLCLLGCRKPLYLAGQVVSGHMVIRPVRNLLITGRWL